MHTAEWPEVAKMTDPASFRDPDGFIFHSNKQVYRQVNQSYSSRYNHLMSSGLYESLVGEGLLIPHEETTDVEAPGKNAFKIIKPENIDFISYPYEWCFSQLKDAALLTLDILNKALAHGMILKDASGYNIQFYKGRPVFIDTLSFDFYEEGKPWAAYKQFCQHFLAPLLLMAKKDPSLSMLLQNHIDGIPLELASKLLPRSTKLNFHILSHIHLHAKSISRYSESNPNLSSRKVKISIKGIIHSLESLVKSLKLPHKKTEWGNYYNECLYDDVSLQHKKQLTEEFLNNCTTGTVWDLGANEGFFSRVASNKGMNTISIDFDHLAIEKNYHYCKQNGDTNILPLVADLSTPTPAIGWANEERKSLYERGPAKTVMALAVIHHLAISKAIPLQSLAKLLNRICENLIMEFVPREDPQVQKLLRNRPDIFPDYYQEGFEHAFGEYFTIRQKQAIKGSERILYLFTAK